MVSDLSSFNPLWIMVGLAVAGALIAIGKWIGAVNSDRGSFKKFTVAVRDDLKDIQNDIKKMLHWQSSKTIDSQSPLRLTEIGQKVSDLLDIPAITEMLVSTLRPQVEGKQPYDIQERCFAYVRDEYEPSPELDARIKQCAYDNGLDRDEVLDVLAVVLRDKLLASPSTNQQNGQLGG